MGLMPTPTQGAPYADPNAPAQPDQGQQGQDEQSNVSPEEQQLYDTFMGKAAEIIYGDGKVMPQILDALKAGADSGGGSTPAPAPPPQGGDGDGADAEGAADQASEQAPQGDGDGSDAEGAGEQAADPNAQAAGKGNPAIMALANTATQIVSKLDASSKQAGQQIPDDVLYHGGAEIVGMLAEIAEAAGFHSYSEQEIQGAFFQAVDNYRPIAEAMGRTDDKTLKDQFGQILDADAHGQLGQVLPGADALDQQSAPQQGAGQ